MESHEVINDTEKEALYSEDLHEIMGKTPHWLIKWGISLILLLIILTILASVFIKYPDTIKTSIIINSETPPVNIIARSSGKISALLTKNGKSIKRNEVLAVLENSANFTNVQDLKKKIANPDLFFNSLIRQENIFQIKYSLGPLQSSFSNFKRQFEEYNNYLNLGYLDKKINSIRIQQEDFSHFIEKINNQLKIQENFLEISKRQYYRDSLLFSNKVMAQAEFEKSEQSYLQIKNGYQILLASNENTKMQINQLNYQIIDIESQKLEQKQSRIASLKEAYDNLQASIDEWEKNYVLVSPINGIITFNRFWSQNQFVNSNEIVFTIIPIENREIVGRIKIPIAGSGKVKIGQKVLIKIDNFPYLEFGLLEGRLESISQVPESTKDGFFYTAVVSLPKGLTTTYNKKLPFQQDIQGIAEVITNNVSLFNRLFNPLKSLIKNPI